MWQEVLPGLGQLQGMKIGRVAIGETCQLRDWGECSVSLHWPMMECDGRVRGEIPLFVTKSV